MGGMNGHNTRIITAYNPCKNKSVNSGTSYQQQRRYFITRKKDLTCPLVLFRRDLIKQLKEWQTAGDKIILFMDHNKYVTKGALEKVWGTETDWACMRQSSITREKAQGPFSSEYQNPSRVCEYVVT